MVRVLMLSEYGPLEFYTEDAVGADVLADFITKPATRQQEYVGLTDFVAHGGLETDVGINWNREWVFCLLVPVNAVP